PAVGIDPCRTWQSKTWLAQIEILAIPVRERHAEQGSVFPIAPVMIAAGERVGSSVRCNDDLGATVRAPIAQDVDRAIVVANKDHGFAAEPRRNEVAWPGYLALMPHVDPRSIPNSSHLQIEHCLVSVYSTVDPIRLYERTDIGRAECGFLASWH